MTKDPVLPELEAPGSQVDPTARRVRLLALAAIVGVGIYVLLDVVVQLLPPHYNPVRQAESDLAVGPYGWIMRINFVVRGLLSASLLGALLLRRRPTARARLGMWIWGCWCVGAFVLAIFNTDLGGAERTTHGKIHLAVALIAFVAAPIAAIVLSPTNPPSPGGYAVSLPPSTVLLTPTMAAPPATHPATAQRLASDRNWTGHPQWATIAAFASLGFLVLMRLLAKGDAGGLTERLFLASVLVWVVVVAAGLVRSSPRFARGTRSSVPPSRVG